jgi:hypothetical protein
MIAADVSPSTRRAIWLTIYWVPPLVATEIVRECRSPAVTDLVRQPGQQ